MPKKEDPPDLSGSKHGTVGAAWTAQSLVTTAGGPGGWVTGYYLREPEPEPEEDSEDVN